MVISENVKIKGDLKFETLLRIDGTVEGTISAPITAGLIIGEAGLLLGNVIGPGTVLVEGRVIGNIHVESLILGGNSIVHGDISSRSIEIVPCATIVGQIHIAAFDPFAKVDKRGKIDPTGMAVQEEDDPNESERNAAAALAAAGLKKNKPPVKIVLLVIDPQVDFHPGGACPVPNANEDSERIAELISMNVEGIDEIFVTLDTHHRMHIAHGIAWKDSDGNPPPPYTTIGLTDLKAGRWVPRDPHLMSHCKFYLKELEVRGASKGLPGVLTVKPEHCLIGTVGHSVVPMVNEALQSWAQQRMRKIAYIMKGSSCLTDFTSAFSADVEIEVSCVCVCVCVWVCDFYL